VPEIEFTDDGGERPDSGAEVLGGGPRPRLPRWLYGIVALIVAALLAGVAANLHSNGHPQAAPASSGTASSGTAPSGTAPSGTAPSGPVTPDFEPAPTPRVSPNAAFRSSAVVGHDNIQAMAVASGKVVVLEPGVLARVDEETLGSIDVLHFGLPLGDPSYADWRLVSDAVHLWAVALGPSHRVRQIDPVTLEPGPIIRLPHRAGSIVDAAALDGHLYLETARSVFDVAASHATSTAVPGLRGGESIATDESGHRVLVAARHGKTTTVRAYSPTRRRVVRSAQLTLKVKQAGEKQPLPIEPGQLAVVDGHPWLGGRYLGSVLLLALNPKTLHVEWDRSDPGDVGANLAIRPELVAGQDSLFVRSPGSGDQLWCTGADHARVHQHWSAVPGLVATGDYMFVADENVVGKLALNNRCVG
jgi:hypothetical protein